MEKTIWTPPMSDLLRVIESNNYKGFASMQLDKEDENDFLDFLNNKSVSFLLIKIEDVPFSLSNQGIIYDFLDSYKISIYTFGDRNLADISLAKIDAVIKETYGYSVIKNSKYLVQALCNYAEKHLVLTEGKKVIEKLWEGCEFPIPFIDYNLSKYEESECIIFSKSELKFSFRGKSYPLKPMGNKNEKTQAITIVESLLCDGLESLSEEQFLKRSGKRGRSLSGRELYKAVRHLNEMLEPLINLLEPKTNDKLFVYRDKKAYLNPGIKDRVRITK